MSHFPIALLAIAPLADASAWLLGEAGLWHVGFWCMVGGLVAAIPTAIAGLFDFVALPTDSPAAKTATWHMIVMFTAVSLSAASLMVRRGASPADSPLVVVALESVGAATLLVGGWLGGELVFGHGVGVRGSESD